MEATIADHHDDYVLIHSFHYHADIHKKTVDPLVLHSAHELCRKAAVLVHLLAVTGLQ